MSAETQEGSVAVLWSNYFCFTRWLLILKSLVLHLQTHQDLPCLPCTHRPEVIQTGRRASCSAPHSPTASPPAHTTSQPILPISAEMLGQVNIPRKSYKADHFKRLLREAKKKLSPQKTYQGFSNSMAQHRRKMRAKHSFCEVNKAAGFCFSRS